MENRKYQKMIRVSNESHKKVENLIKAFESKVGFTPTRTQIVNRAIDIIWTIVKKKIKKHAEHK